MAVLLSYYRITAVLYMQILNQFKDEGLETDLVDMQRYAAWKAADIRKALREGRTPTPGAPGGDVLAASTLTPSGWAIHLPHVVTASIPDTACHTAACSP